MSGNPEVVWLFLIGGMLLQLTYMILPFQPWDWARYLGSAVYPAFMIASTESNHTEVGPQLGLMLCGAFTVAFAVLFEKRLLPRLGEGAILMWTVVLLCVLLEIGAWEVAATRVVLGIGLCVILLLVVRRSLPYILKLAVYGWFLLTIVAMGVLQFRGSDLSLITGGRADQLDYVFALIDGMAGAFIGVHAAFLFELLPIPGKSERWADFKVRYRGYIDLVAERFDDQRLDRPVALMLVGGIIVVICANHLLALIPGRTFANLVLIGLPIAWRLTSPLWIKGRPAAATTPISSETPQPTMGTQFRSGTGRAHHSRKHRQ